MEIVLYIIASIAFLYVSYSLISMLVKVKKAGRAKCSFRMSLSKMISRGIGILIVISAALVYKSRGNEGWLPFLCLAIINVVDFIVESVEVRE